MEKLNDILEYDLEINNKNYGDYINVWLIVMDSGFVAQTYS